MTTSNLVLHRGARIVTREEMDMMDAPAPTKTWFPLRHGTVLDAVLSTLEDASFRVNGMQLSLSSDNARFFGTLDLATPIAQGTTLAVGVRNSIDKTFPLGFCAGCRVFVCDNLAFHSELLVSRKHTVNGRFRFQEAIALAVKGLGQFRETETIRIKRMRDFTLTDQHAESLILRAFEQGIVSIRTLPQVIKAWREPPYAEFEDHTLWALLNAFTGVLNDLRASNPQRFALQTIQLGALLEPGVN
jgi:hypothetical protein